MASVVMNGGIQNSSNQSMNDDSDESFVVLSPSLAPDNLENIMSINSSVVQSFNTMTQIPDTEMQTSEAINAMSVSTTSELSPDEIHSKLESLFQENLQLKETLHQNNLAMKKQFTTLESWQEDVMKVHQSHKEKFEETKKLITNLRSENTELKKTIMQQSITKETTSIDNEKLNLKSKISALEFELDTLRQGYMKNQTKQTQKIEELENKLKTLESEKEKIKIIETVTKQNETVKSENLSLQDKLNVAQKRILEMAEKIPSISAKDLIEKMTQELTETRADLDYKNKTLTDKSEIVEKLTKENKQLKDENETIFIYKTQVIQYQKDFNAEREARNAIHEEKERIAEDLRHLHRRNEELLLQIEQLHKEGFPHFSNSASGSNNGARTQQPKQEDFSCPKCFFKFQTLQALENHVYRCIELDILP